MRSNDKKEGVEQRKGSICGGEHRMSESKESRGLSPCKQGGGQSQSH